MRCNLLWRFTILRFGVRIGRIRRSYDGWVLWPRNLVSFAIDTNFRTRILAGLLESACIGTDGEGCCARRKSVRARRQP